MTTTSRTSRRVAASTVRAATLVATTTLTSIAGITSPALAGGDIVSWQSPVDGIWSEENSWAPHVPLPGDYVLIGGSVNAENTTVTMAFSLYGLQALVLSDGMELYTSIHQLDMSGATVRVKDANEVEEGSGRSTLWIENSGFSNDFIADTLSVENEGVVRLVDGATALVTSLIDIEDESIIVGEGHLRLQGDNGVALDVSGAIRGLESGITIDQEGDAPLDLDGSGEDGVLLRNITVNSGPLTDPFDGTMWLLSNDRMVMNVANGWLLGPDGELMMASSGGNARLQGEPMGVQGTVTVVGTGNAIDSDVVVFPSGRFDLQINDFLTMTGDVIASGGRFLIEGDSTLHFAGTLETNDTEFRLEGGTVVGAELENDEGGLIHGWGSVGAPVDNDGLIAADGGTLILAGFANDLDGDSGAGVLEALTGDLHLLYVTEPWFDGTMRIGAGHEVFADGFSLLANGSQGEGVQMMGGTLRSDETAELYELGVTAPSTIDAALLLPGGAEVALGDDLTLLGATTVWPGAEVFGPGTMINEASGLLTLRDGTDVASDIRSFGTFRLHDGVGTMIAQGHVESLGTCEIELDTPDAHDRLIVGGTLTLAGLVEVSVIGPAPELGDTFDVFDFDAMQDGGYTMSLPQLAPGLGWDLSDFESAGIIRVGVDTCPADINGDGSVDFADLLMVLAAWDTPNPSADIDESGLVGFGDLLIVLSAWGAC